MKINGHDIDIYLAGIRAVDEGYAIDREDISTNKRPSTMRKHVWDLKEVKRILNKIDQNTTWNLYLETRSRWESFMDRPMTYYRGYTKTGAEVFDEVDKMIKAFDIIGLERGDEIVLCMSNVPELLTILLAASHCGLVLRPISNKATSHDIQEIFSQIKDKKLFIGTDDKYGRVEKLVRESGFRDKIIISLSDSLENGVDPYDDYDKLVYKFVNNVPNFKKDDRDIMSYSEFLGIADKWFADDNGFAKRSIYVPEGAIDEPFIVTHTTDYLSEFAHSNRPYITKAHFRKLLSLPNMRELIHIPVSFDTGLTCITDAITNVCTVAFEPIYHPKFLLYSMAINQPNNVAATRSFLIEMMRNADKHPDVAAEAFKNAVIINTVDEMISKSEENYINRGLKKAKAGCEVLPRLTTTLSVSGCGRGMDNLFFTPFRARYEDTVVSSILGKEHGLKPYPFVKVAVLDEALNECGYGEYGRLVTDCGTVLDGSDIHKDVPSIMDNEGHVWDDSQVWGAILKNGNVLVKGNYADNFKLSDGQKIPYFMIADKLMEQEGVMSCEVVKPEGLDDVLVAHIGITPDGPNLDQEGVDSLIYSLEETSYQCFAPELADRVVYKIRPNNAFPLTSGGMRSTMALEEEGLDGCYKPRLYEDWDHAEIIPASEYLKSFDSSDEDSKGIQKVKREDK